MVLITLCNENKVLPFIFINFQKYQIMFFNLGLGTNNIAYLEQCFLTLLILRHLTIEQSGGTPGSNLLENVQFNNICRPS